MTITDDMIERAMRAWKAVALGRQHWTPHDAMRAALTAALASQPAEPVAVVRLMERGGNAGLATVIHEIDDPLRERLQPGTKLYAAPQPQRVPLTPAQVSHIADEAGYGTRDPSLRARFISGIRAAERAHGITPADLEEKSNG